MIMLVQVKDRQQGSVLQSQMNLPGRSISGKKKTHPLLVWYMYYISLGGSVRTWVVL